MLSFNLLGNVSFNGRTGSSFKLFEKPVDKSTCSRAFCGALNFIVSKRWKVQDLFFEVVRKKQHIFCDARDNVSVSELKKIIEGILKVPMSDQTLVKFCDDGNFTNHQTLDERKTLSECGFNHNNAKAQAPATIGLLVKGDASMIVDELSQPPPIPDAMRQEPNQE